MEKMLSSDVRMDPFAREVSETQQWFCTPRFKGITRLYTARQVVEQRGAIQTEYPIARDAAEGFFNRLRELFSRREQITTFGPYSPGQAVAIKRMGIEAIYLGGWATSAKGSTTEDPGPDLASYPLSQVPDEASTLVRALLAADKNQEFARSRMDDDDDMSRFLDDEPAPAKPQKPAAGAKKPAPPADDDDLSQFLDDDVPAAKPQKPGVKKCGHQAGKVLVPQDEQIKRLNSARFQLDIMRVPGIIVARTDAEAATYLDGRGDERDHPFILGATNIHMPSYKVASLAIFKRFNQKGVDEITGHLLYRISDRDYEVAFAWLEHVGLLSYIDEKIESLKKSKGSVVDKTLDDVTTKFVDVWQMEAALKTYGQAVADVMKFHIDEGAGFDLTIDEWRHFADIVSFREASEKARSMGINITWDCDLSKTPEGYYQIQGGIDYAIEKSLAAAPYADVLWMETKTAILAEAKKFADGIHALYPDKMLAYNLSPSFNWDTTGMTDAQMRDFPQELGKLGFVFNFITYGGHQIDGVAAEEFATALQEDGMLALARLQRKLRLVNSPYKTPQTYVGGPRSDAALMASTGGTPVRALRRITTLLYSSG